MKGDFTRDTFEPEKHYQQVLMQQGRAQLDADWNEQAAIASRRQATTAIDMVGHCGGPAESAGFRLFTDPSQLTEHDKERLRELFESVSPEDQPPVNLYGSPPSFDLTREGDFFVSAGRYYVNGIQCENEFAIPFTAQPDLLDVKPLNQPMGEKIQPLYLIYLDVWHRHLTALDDPGIREPALGGPDTGTRVKTVWQVRCDIKHEYDSLLERPTARLSARTLPGGTSDDPCVVPESAGYKGLENQLYRVEIHKGSKAPGGPTWKWSRENGSVTAEILRIAEEKITLATLGADDRLGFRKDDWVELLDDALELESQPGQLLRVMDFSPLERTLTLDSSVTPLDPKRHPKVRRWEGCREVPKTADPNTDWLPLENGIQIFFDNLNATYRTGEYWQIPARAATANAPAGDIEWPRELDSSGKPNNNKPLSQPPQGIIHHYCLLAIARWQNGKLQFTDYRCLWPSLTHVPRLFYVGGDGQEVMPVATQTPSANGHYKLPRPLVAGVANPQCLERPTLVHFMVVNTKDSPSGGWVVAAGATPPVPNPSGVDVPLNSAGLAKCDFYLDAVNPTQQVTAYLLDSWGQQVSLPIVFNANLSIADQVAYDPPKDCDGLSGQNTVQAAITRLASMASIYKVSGDGQHATAHVYLKDSLKVLVADRCGPRPGISVTFTVTLGGGSVPLAPVSTDRDGIASCKWQLGNESVLQVVEATVPDDMTTEPRKVHFVAHLTGEGSNDPAPVHVVELSLIKSQKTLANDAEVTLTELEKGLRILCDEKIATDTVLDPARESGELIRRGQPTCFVTAEIPIPLSPSDMIDFERWGLDNKSLVGYRPIVLHGSVTSGVPDRRPAGLADRKPKCEIKWVPYTSVLDYLEKVLNAMGSQLKPSPDKLLLRLTLKGNFIWSEGAEGLFKKGTPGGFLDGDSFRSPKVPGVLLPSGDGRRGGDFEMWFWIQKKPKRVVLLGNPGVVAFKGLSKLRRQGLAEALSLALDRAFLRGLLPPEFEVDVSLKQNLTKAQDLVKTNTLQKLSFKTWSEPALFKINQEIAGMAGKIGIVVKPQPVNDLLKELNAANGSEKAPDAVLVDESLADEVRPLGYSYQIVTL